MSKLDEILTAIKDESAYALAGRVSIARPDGPDSPGAKLLSGARNNFVEQVEYIRGDLHFDYDFSEIIEQIAGDQPNVYTHPLWEEFTDLCAYTEDLSGQEIPEDMGDVARWALKALLMRMLEDLAESVTEALAADETEDDDEE